MICDRCRSRIHYSSNPDQPLCRCCCEHLRAGGDWPLGSPTPDAACKPIPCMLDLLPLRALLVYGEVPLYPDDSAFHSAAMDVSHNEHDPAAHWQMEAIRWRRQNRGAPLNDGIPIIAGRTAARLWRLAERNVREAVAS